MSGQKKAGRRLGSVPVNKFPSVLPEMEGTKCGSLMVTSGEVIRVGVKNRPYLMTQCTECGRLEKKSLDTLKKLIAGCRKCGRKRHKTMPCLGVPKWLLARCISAKERCSNPKSSSWKNYGGRGIMFRFASPSLMGVWVMENLGVNRDMEIDRINNDGHYEPGNLRLVSQKVNGNNRRGKGGVRRMHKFRMLHPEVKYADSTLSHLLGDMGLTFAEVVARFSRKSNKPKGVYGTFSTPDPTIASLAKDS